MDELTMFDAHQDEQLVGGRLSTHIDAKTNLLVNLLNLLHHMNTMMVTTTKHFSSTGKVIYEDGKLPLLNGNSAFFLNPPSSLCHSTQFSPDCFSHPSYLDQSQKRTSCEAKLHRRLYQFLSSPETMCNGSSNRTSQGGAIAALHPSSSSDRTDEAFKGDILFYQNEPTSIRAAFCPKEFGRCGPFPGCHVVIHQDGNLNATVMQPPLHQFQLKPYDTFYGSETAELLPGLELSVGGDGIIGRRVTVHSDKRMERVVAEGIIGWN